MYSRRNLSVSIFEVIENVALVIEKLWKFGQDIQYKPCIGDSLLKKVILN